jgi:dolichyl-phosphate-mannose-protein mannosyltransferase
MFSINNGLTSTHPYDSRPLSWPLLRRGMAFWSSKDKENPANIHLIGNPVVWLGAFAALLVYVAYNTVVALLIKRQIIVNEDERVGDAMEWAGCMCLCWALHYLPFFIMERQLFLHHYLPALYFSILCAGMILEGGSRWLNKRGDRVVYIALALATILIASMIGYYLYAPFTYGFPISKEWCEKVCVH